MKQKIDTEIFSEGFSASDVQDVRIDFNKYRIRETPQAVHIMFKIFKYLVLATFCIIFLLPLVIVILGSFKENVEFLQSNVFALPKSFYTKNYEIAFINGKVMLGLINTMIILVVSCFGTIITGTMTAFVLQRFRSMYTNIVKGLFLLATLLPSISMQITVYQIINKIGIMDTLMAPMLLYIGTDIISIYIFIQFLNNISISLDESAIIDGASYPRVFFQIILPLLKPAIATVLIIKIVGIYNDFYTAQLYMKDQELPVVSTALYRFIGPYGAKWEVIFAGVVICIIPTLIIFLLLQKHIYSGLVSGSTKE